MPGRAADLAALEARTSALDLVVIGGGANGAGIALDAASRGLSVALFERGEFASGTSSRSSKLIHGGVRYLALGQWGLVREALAEQDTLLHNAPDLVQPLRFLLPAYSWFDAARFRLGLKCYDLLAGGRGLEPSAWLGREPFIEAAGPLRDADLRGGVAYDDAFFDDAALVQALLTTARRHGALTLNHAEVTAVVHASGGRTSGVRFRDHLAGDAAEFEVPARVVINAAGPYGDAVRRLDCADIDASVTPSQGTHIVVHSRFGAGNNALVLPRTPDGRIMFVIPWHGHALLGTTDIAATATAAPPRPAASEIDSILNVCADFLDPAPSRTDILSAFAGLRPLAGGGGGTTSRKSREHAFDVSASGLLSVSGGKWTTYRLIAEQAVDLATSQAGLRAGPCRTRELALDHATSEFADERAALAAAAPDLAAPLHPALAATGLDIVFTARAGYCASVADALSFHSRAMFIDARAAAAAAPRVAAIMAKELKRDDAWVSTQIAQAEKTAATFLPD